ncbi:peptidase domain-containing ABC transporter [Enterococcus sp. BWB1-3]|uniref:peptidase domain-containing ABC transporter n=1 Tax=Enterococcus sp. BWB1-3 TaxID=2787713 RepID=UPI0019223935|nr:peptidase domain-containing ABC transporter [Enterococcus sp. BWB1-3]MBL1230996.1 peptidase domain-containing ABC transporter [Enterococcus sp. BWB1-3]
MAKYQCIKQESMADCGAACLATICRQYKMKVAISVIRDAAGTDKFGTNAYGLILAAEKLGFSAKGVKGEKEDFLKANFPLPAIAHVIIDNSLQHYVVIHKITPKTVIVADPNEGLKKKSVEDFFSIWTGVLILLHPTVNLEKTDISNGTLKKFLPLLYPQIRLIANIFLASILITLLGIGTSFYFKFIVDDIIPNTLTTSLKTLTAIMIIMYILKNLISFIRGQLMIYLSQKIDIPLILGYYNHVLRMPMNFYGTRQIGEIISRFNDASKIREAISNATVTIMIDGLMAVVGSIVLYTQNNKLFFIALIIAILYSMSIILFNNYLKTANEEQMESNAQLTSYLVESLNGIEMVKSYGVERKISEKTDSLFVKFLNKNFKTELLYNVQGSLGNTISEIGEVFIICIGTFTVFDNALTLGELLTFNTLLIYFLDPIKNLVNLQPTMQTAIVAADRLADIMNLETEKMYDDKKIQAVNLGNSVKFDNISFRYGQRDLTLKNISMEIKNGEKIALVGESGSGKTTLAKLLMKFYEVETGEIYIGDYNIKDIETSILRNDISYISQDNFFFSDTIENNLKIGNPFATLEDIQKACTMAEATVFINQLPTRYQTILQENGSNLSGGQRQRLAIARAIIRNPKILIMDEATSNLDSITEKGIERTINELSPDITKIIIAHRLSTIKNCDKIFVLRNGEIIESGTHEELIRHGNYYAGLWKEQLIG